MGSKISELTALTTPVAADLLVIVDTTASPDTTKKITITSLSTILAPLASPTFTGTVTLPAVTLSGAIAGASQTVNSLGFVGIKGVASADNALNYSEAFTLTDSTSRMGGLFQPIMGQATGAYSGVVTGVSGDANIRSNNTQNWTATVGLRGIHGKVATQTSSAGTITGAAAFYADQGISGAVSAVTLTNFYGMYIPAVALVGNSHLTNCYGIYIDDQAGGATLNYALYCAGANVGFFAALPTSNPNVAGKWWSNAGVVTISAG